MKKYLPYSLIVLIVAAVIVLFITGKGRKHQFDERITLNKKDKIPYGMYVAFENLKYIFPKANISANNYDPEHWENLSIYESNQALIIMTDRFAPDESEMDKLISFVQKGNDIFISTRYISAVADRIFGCNSSSYDLSFISLKRLEENMSLTLADRPFWKKITYDYPGISFYSYFSSIDSTTTDIFGYDKVNRPDFIHLRTGKGNFYIQLEPLGFSNYFLLHKNNIGYYEKSFSLIKPDTKKIIWDEYFLNKIWKENNQTSKSPQSNWLSVLFRYPSLAAALLAAIFTLLLYVLMEMRRKQRYIPLITKPRNDSLDFVKTIGRLYFDKGDHLNLCRKMAAYFLEHIRNVYKLPTNNLNEEFIKALQFKTGIAETEIAGIVSFIRKLDGVHIVNDKQLSIFHKQLESFYKTA